MSRPQYFKVHSDGSLHCYPHEPETTPRHTWSLEGSAITANQGISAGCYPFVLRLQDPSKSVLRLRALDFQQWVAWVDAITKAGASAQAGADGSHCHLVAQLCAAAAAYSE